MHNLHIVFQIAPPTTSFDQLAPRRKASRVVPIAIAQFKLPQHARAACRMLSICITAGSSAKHPRPWRSPALTRSIRACHHMQYRTGLSCRPLLNMSNNSRANLGIAVLEMQKSHVFDRLRSSLEDHF